MSEARECAGCGGGGDDCAVMRSHHEDRPCRFCKGTGKVWPSVDGEVVEEFDPNHKDVDLLKVWGRLHLAMTTRGPSRVIVQPLPSPDVKEEP